MFHLNIKINEKQPQQKKRNPPILFIQTCKRNLPSMLGTVVGNSVGVGSVTGVNVFVASVSECFGAQKQAKMEKKHVCHEINFKKKLKLQILGFMPTCMPA